MTAWKQTVGCMMALATLAGGCSKGDLPEFGQVTGALTQNGKPLSGMQLDFVLQPAPGQELGGAYNVAALTDAQGKYELSYGSKMGRGLGAPVGSYKVTVLPARTEGGPAPKATFKPAYSNITATPLSAEVVAGPQTIDLQVQ